MSVRGWFFSPISVVLIVVSGCSVAPLTGSNSADTVGKSKIKAVTSVYPAVGQGLEYGLGERTDVGVLTEMQGASVFSLWIKQGLLQQETGGSLAAIAGVYYSEAVTTSHGGYVGLLWSYRSDSKWSPYGSLKVNHVTWENDDIEDNDLLDIPDYLSSNADRETFDYYQLNTGVKYQLTPELDMSVGLVVIGDEQEDIFSQPQLSFGFRF